MLNRIEVEPDHLLVRLQLKYLDNTHLLDYQVECDKILDVLTGATPRPGDGTRLRGVG
jgi:hypothetical protein